MKWREIRINTQNIKHVSQRAVLVKMPRKTKYGGCLFWHPKKLINDDEFESWALELIAHDEWEFKLFKDNNNDYETIIDFNEMHECFSGTNNPYKQELDSYLIETEPKKIDIDVEVEESLKR